ncbi:MAG: helix-turn-helix domain-containing protein [Streptosporangiaceae bacterium]
MTTQRRRGAARTIPAEQCAIIGANIRSFRQRHRWSQAELGDLMGWPSPSTVCAAEGRRGDRQRGFTAEEVSQLAVIFDVPASQLTTRCATCGGHPPAGFACLACGATPGSARPAPPALTHPVPDGRAAMRG